MAFVWLVQPTGGAVVAQNFEVNHDASVRLDDEGSSYVRLVSSCHPGSVTSHGNVENIAVIRMAYITCYVMLKDGLVCMDYTLLVLVTDLGENEVGVAAVCTRSDVW